MKKKMYQSVVATHFREHSSIYLFVVVLFLMGVIFGAIVVNSLTFSQKEDLAYYLSQFFGEVSNGKVAASKDVFTQSLFDNSKFIGMMGILGISIIGLPVILIVLFMKGLVIGFTVGFLVNQMGWNGFLLSFVSVLPQNFIIIPVFIITATVAVSISLKMIRRQFMKKISEPILPLLGRYALVFVVAGLFLVIAALFEAYISPSLMKTVIETVY
jgi:stage II sporulation protein M